MVFSSLLFLFRFLPLALILYFLSPKRARNAVLFFISLIFYAWGEPVYMVLMIFSTVVDYLHGRLVERWKAAGDLKKARLTVASSAIINLGLLALFKYSGRFPLPIGISFYTFQTMSYTIDVYRQDARAQRNILSFGTYVAMFPQLIAGPIVQYKSVARELDERKETLDKFSEGIHLFVMGLGKKVLFANGIGMLWELISKRPPEEIPVVMAWLGITAFAFQIYFDFSGYSDMARGLGSMFGFTFPLNFDYPYRSKSITEFWRRWHISLGTWFREYVYIPLGGNRKGFSVQIRNILIVWILTGIWHGASLNFLFWGIYYGVILMAEKAVLLKWQKKWPFWGCHLYTMTAVLIGWVLFAFEDMALGLYYLKAMAGLLGNSLFSRETGYLLLNYGVLLLVLILASAGTFKTWGQRFTGYLKADSVPVFVGKNLLYAGIILLSVAYLVDSSYNPFLYFRF